MSDYEPHASDSEPELSVPAPEALLKPGSPADGMLKVLGDAVTSDIFPCYNGVFPVKPQDLVLYYRQKDGHCGHVDFCAPSAESLEKLNAACQAATFGLDQKDVLDETYRKAGKMDNGYFAMNFNPIACGLLPSMRDLLLQGHPSTRQIRAELYKLNVYGPGSFFKMHKDTPREADMFGSLVVILPTPHAGGSLHFRHGKSEYTFDSAAVVGETTTPCVGFAAFFSDLDHEVLPVESGYRVTLTYNLYFADGDRSTPSAYEAANVQLGGQSLSEAAIEKAFKDLMADPEFLPKGGYIGFGLYHEYACGPREVLPKLKGTDSLLAKVVQDISLVPKIKIVYKMNQGHVLCDDEPDIYLMDDEWVDCTNYFRRVGGELFDLKDPDYDPRHSLPVVDVVWATPMAVKNVSNKNTITFPAYGNEPSVGHMYGTMCLVVAIPKLSKRRGSLADQTVSGVVSGDTAKETEKEPGEKDEVEKQGEDVGGVELRE